MLKTKQDKPLLWLFICAVVCFSAFSSATDKVSNKGTDKEINREIDISIPAIKDDYGLHTYFVKELLKLIASSQHYSINFIYQGSNASQNRIIQLLTVGKVIDIGWGVLDDQIPRGLIKIKYPIYQNKIGWRVLFINQDNADTFKHITTLEQLKKLTAVQKFDWADFKVLQNNGLKVESDMSYEGQSKAVERGLVDYYPRSVIEAVKELNAPFNSELIIEPNLLIKYPSGYYFYVNKGNKKLADVISNGFKLIIENGSYQKLFDNYFADDLKQLKLEQRRVILLKN